MQDVVVALHVSGVAKVDSALIGTFIRSVLQGNDRVSGSELLLSKLTGVFLGFLGTNGRQTEFGCLFQITNLELRNERNQVCETFPRFQSTKGGPCIRSHDFCSCMKIRVFICQFLAARIWFPTDEKKVGNTLRPRA